MSFLLPDIPQSAICGQQAKSEYQHIVHIQTKTFFEEEKFMLQKTKKSISVLLSLLMVLSVFGSISLTVSALEGTPVTDTLPTSEGTYYLTQDILLSGTWNTPNGTTTLDLNGHTITANGNFAAITVASSTNLTIKGQGTLACTGNICALVSYGTLNFYDATTDCIMTHSGTANVYSGDIMTHHSGFVTVNASGGTINVYDASARPNGWYCVYAGKNGVVNLYGGVFKEGPTNPARFLLQENGGKINVAGGYFPEGITNTYQNSFTLAPDCVIVDSDDQSKGAKMVKGSYTVTLDNQEATTAGAASVTATYGQVLPSIAENLPEKDGYAFGGYFSETNGKGTQYINADGTPTESTWTKAGIGTLYAKWDVMPATAPTVSGADNLELTYGYDEGNISVEASAANGHTLSYQWYNAANDSPIENATAATYTIPTGKAAGTQEAYYCIVTATRTDNGQTATATSDAATVTVAKADPTYAAPTDLTANCNDTLESIELPEGWTWDDPTESVGVVGADAETKDAAFAATFTPADTDNYNTVSETLTVTVSHDLENHDGQPATCVEEGWNAYQNCKCEGCGYTTYEAIDATGQHTAGEPEINTKPATCGEDGYTITTTKCAVCGEVLESTTLVMLATGKHTTKIVNAKEATATEDGYTGDEVCTVCNQTIKTGEVIPATGEPTPDEPTPDKPETPDEPTKDGYRCDFCDRYEAWKDIPYFGWVVSLVHIFVHMAAHIGDLT